MNKILNKKVKDFMVKKVITAHEKDPIKNVFKLMDKHGILGVPVVDDKDHVVGLLTETDLVAHFTTITAPTAINLLGSLVYIDDVKEFNDQLKDHCAESVGELMNKNAVVINENDTLQNAIDLMSTGRVIRLPVTDKKGVLKGIITRTDIVHQLAQIKNL